MKRVSGAGKSLLLSNLKIASALSARISIEHIHSTPPCKQHVPNAVICDDDDDDGMGEGNNRSSVSA